MFQETIAATEALLWETAQVRRPTPPQRRPTCSNLLLFSLCLSQRVTSKLLQTGGNSIDVLQYLDVGGGRKHSSWTAAAGAPPFIYSG